MANVTLVKKNGNELVEQMNCDAFSAIMLLCKINHVICDKGKIIKTNFGYEYEMRTGDVIIAV